MPLIKKSTYEVDQNELQNHYENFNENHKKETNKNCFVYTDKHYYIDYETGEYCTCIDKEYWH